MNAGANTQQRIFGINPDHLACAAAAIIICVSLLPESNAVGVSSSDTVNHIIAYGTLTTLALINRTGTATIIVALLAIVAFGGGVEIIQPLFGRKAECSDLAANLIGVAVGCFLALAVRLSLRSKRSKIP